MKSIFKFTLILIAFGFVVSCDKIKAPYKQNQPIAPIDTTKQGNDTTPVYDDIRKVLIEDYTGHTCGNCPKAGKKLDELMELYGNKIVPLAVHAGSFADSLGTPFSKNLKSTVSTALDVYFGISLAGNPNGMVNRKGYPNGNILNFNSWNSVFAQAQVLNQDAAIAIRNNYNATAQRIETTVYTKFKNALNGTFRLCVYLTEDSIIGAQKDYDFLPTEIIDQYTFNHVLRASFNDTWGDILTTDPAASETIVYQHKYGLNLKGKLKDINHPCNVVAFVYNDATKEIVQASLKKIK